MKTVQKGAEHNFLTFVEKLKVDPNGWIASTFGFSKGVSFEDMVERRAFLGQELMRHKRESDAFLEIIKSHAKALPNAHVYQFKDNDIILLCCPKTESEQEVVRKVLEEMTSQLPKHYCDYGFLTKELHVFQKIADYKLLTAKKMEAYDVLSQGDQLKSIALRRKRRDEPVVLVVEDDRFTASYINNFLKDFDVVTARTGEDALLKYIEYAPDAVFLDIHLPGINGQQVLQGIMAADPDAFVVMLSVDTAKSTIMDATEHGAVSYLKKPFSRERVLNTLRLSPFIRQSRGIMPIEFRDRM